jgi:serine/threonine protein phosphatase 1
MQTERSRLNPAIIRTVSGYRELKANLMLVTYAVGDVHGALHKLESLIARCRDHAGGRAARFVFLGDYIDRGPQSAGVIRCLMELEAQLPGDVVSLMGNHEQMLLSIIDGEVSADDWLPQGGSQTLESYGIEDVRDLPCDHVDWLRALRLSYDDGRRFFAHAGVNPERPLDAQDDHDLLWIREPFLSDPRDYGRLIVHGHTPVENGVPDLRGNRLDLDTRAGYGGPVTAAVFSHEATLPLAFFAAA